MTAPTQHISKSVRAATIAAALCFGGALGKPLGAQVAVNVPPDDPAYLYLDDLAAFGLMISEVGATRPYSRAYISQLVTEARQRFETDPEAYPYPLARRALEYLERRFGPEARGRGLPRPSGPLRLGLLDDAGVSYANIKDQEHPELDPNIDALVQPLVAYREGRGFREGQNFAFESRHWMGLGGWLGLYYQGRVVGTDPRTSTGVSSNVDLETLRLYLKLTRWNTSLLIGREGFQWGPGDRGNLIFSTNARPIGSFEGLPLIKLSNETPFRLPWILRGLGPMRYQLFVTQMEEERSDFAEPFLVGLRLDFRPGRNVELGLSHSYMMGGDNFPVSFSFWDAVAEFFFIRSKEGFIFNVRTSRGPNPANHVMGVDLSFRFPSLRNAEVYGELGFDDLTFKLNKTVDTNMAIRVGGIVPRLTPDGRVSAAFEVTHTGSVMYESSPLPAGFTRFRRIFGNDIGGSSNEVYGRLAVRPRADTRLAVTVNYQARGVHRPTMPDLPVEKRLILGANLLRRLLPSLFLELEADYMRTLDFAHVQGDHRNGFFLGVTVRALDLMSWP